MTWKSISGLTDLRTEDSGKLGCRLVEPEKKQRFELLKDFAVIGKCTFVFSCLWHFQSVTRLVLYFQYCKDYLTNRLVANKDRQKKDTYRRNNG